MRFQFRISNEIIKIVNDECDTKRSFGPYSKNIDRTGILKI